MRKIVSAGSLLFAAGALVFGLAATQTAAAADLTVVSWGGAYQEAQKKAYFTPFVEQTKTPMHEESWDGGIGVLRAKVQGGSTNWDVVQVESDELQIGCEEGIYEKIDWTKVGGKDAYLPAAVSDCGVGAILYNFILSYDGDKTKAGPASWADFFDLAKFPGKRGLRKGPKTSLEFALIADGVPLADVYKVLATDAGVDRAFAKLDAIKSEMIWWEAGAQPPQLLASGEVAMTSAYNGRVTAANQKEAKNFKIVWNESLYTLDSWVILKGSQNLDKAYTFLNFVGEAKNQKLLPEYISYGVTNKDASGQIKAELLPDLPTNPKNLENAIQIDTAFWLENLDRLTERFNKWAAK